MVGNEEQEEVLTIVAWSTTKKDETTVHCRTNNCDIKNNMTIEETKFKMSNKQKLFRTGAANILKRLFDGPKTDENDEIRPSSMIPKKSNVARRGKPFRPQARRTRFIDHKLPNSNPETLTELVSERNFCESLLKNKDVPNDVKSFIESRMTYVNYKLRSLI